MYKMLNIILYVSIVIFYFEILKFFLNLIK